MVKIVLRSEIATTAVKETRPLTASPMALILRSTGASSSFFSVHKKNGDVYLAPEGERIQIFPLGQSWPKRRVAWRNSEPLEPLGISVSVLYPLPAPNTTSSHARHPQKHCRHSSPGEPRQVGIRCAEARGLHDRDQIDIPALPPYLPQQGRRFRNGASAAATTPVIPPSLWPSSPTLRGSTSGCRARSRTPATTSPARSA